MKPKILIVDDEEKIRKFLALALKKEDYEVRTVGTAEAALASIQKEKCDLIITDLRMPGKSGLELLREVKKIDPSTEVIMITAYATAETAVKAMKEGAYDYIIKPFKLDEIKIVVRRALEKIKLTEENLSLRRELGEKYKFENIVGTSKLMQEVFARTIKVAPAMTTVLLRGESGTGKELIAKAIHQKSQRAAGPFVKVNCGAIPETLLESELFGHEKGAFTSAVSRRIGRFELADGGTIFLDEIGDLTPALQVKLLRVLQEKEFERIGGEKVIKVDVRIIAATNKNLEKLLEEKKFREDLYYRLNVVSISLPPLRERREEIPALVDFFLKEFKSKKKITPEVLKVFMNYSWPGNVRELRNVIEHGIVMSKDEVIKLEDLPFNLSSREGKLDFNIGSLYEGFSLEELEKNLLIKALRQAEGNQTKASRLLGLTRRTFSYRLEKYNLGKKIGKPKEKEKL
jgi:DNA-binding NtrC family response regulator